jgi:hypothetical protein
MRVSIAIAGLLCFSTYVSAQPNRQLYELQERCGKRAAEVFARDYGYLQSTKRVDLQHNYQSHYNARLNKCFFVVSTRAIAKSPKDQAVNFIALELYDVNEKASYGMYNRTLSEKAPTYCAASGRTCSSQEEWEELVHPYMNE